jgi:hypothetical protein
MQNIQNFNLFVFPNSSPQCLVFFILLVLLDMVVCAGEIDWTQYPTTTIDACVPPGAAAFPIAWTYADRTKFAAGDVLVLQLRNSSGSYSLLADAVPTNPSPLVYPATNATVLLPLPAPGLRVGRSAASVLLWLQKASNGSINSQPSPFRPLMPGAVSMLCSCPAGEENCACAPSCNGANLMCWEGKACVQQYNNCTETSECTARGAISRQCVGGLCVASSCPSVVSATPGVLWCGCSNNTASLCVSEAECKNGICKPSQLGRQCKHDGGLDECGSSGEFTCQASGTCDRCEPGSYGCLCRDGACSGALCRNGRCSIRTGCAICPCGADDYCDSGLSCTLGYCRPPRTAKPPVTKPPCVAGAEDCPCTDSGLCFSSSSSSNLTCIGRACVQLYKACTSNEQCTAGGLAARQCVAARCVSNACTGTTLGAPKHTRCCTSIFSQSQACPCLVRGAGCPCLSLTSLTHAAAISSTVREGAALLAHQRRQSTVLVSLMWALVPAT